MMTPADIPVNTPREPVLDYLATMYANWPTDKLQKHKEHFERHVAQFGDRNPNWVANCAEPNLTIINATLAQRPAC